MLRAFAFKCMLCLLSACVFVATIFITKTNSRDMI